MAHRWSQLVAWLPAGSLVLGACAASPSSPASQSAASSPRAGSPPVSSAIAGSSATAGSAVQAYLDAVDKLCDALLPKVVAVTSGGSLDIPVKKYLAQQPAHAKLLADFDRKLAQVPVPPAANDKAAAFAAYVRLANRLDAKRLAAARRGAAAYAKEIKSEASVESNPAITALGAAGFNQSCEAR